MPLLQRHGIGAAEFLLMKRLATKYRTHPLMARELSAKQRRRKQTAAIAGAAQRRALSAAASGTLPTYAQRAGGGSGSADELKLARREGNITSERLADADAVCKLCTEGGQVSDRAGARRLACQCLPVTHTVTVTVTHSHTHRHSQPHIVWPVHQLPTQCSVHPLPVGSGRDRTTLLSPVHSRRASERLTLCYRIYLPVKQTTQLAAARAELGILSKRLLNEGR